MNDSPKIQLSPFEKQLVNDSAWLLTKNAILEKIRILLSAMQECQQALLKAPEVNLPVEVMQSSSKISRGENYLGLPWMVLDQPRYFDKQSTFAIRTMFWWGRFFSTTLQLSGQYKEAYQLRVIDAYDLLTQNDFYINHSDSPWNHHFEKDNYIPLKDTDRRAFTLHIKTHPFIKLAKKRSLHDWNMTGQQLLSDYELMIRIVG